MTNVELIRQIAEMKGISEKMVILTPDYIITLEEGCIKENSSLSKQGYSAYIKGTLYEDADAFEDEAVYDSFAIPVYDYISHMDKEEVLALVVNKVYGIADDLDEYQYAA